MKRGLSNKTWLALLAGALALCALAAALIFLGAPRGTVAVVTLDGAEVCRVDLSQVEESRELTFTGASGITDVVELAPGRVRVCRADCPDQVCVRQGWIAGGVAPIVCLPNRLTIQIVDGGASADAVAR